MGSKREVKGLKGHWNRTDGTPETGGAVRPTHQTRNAGSLKGSQQVRGATEGGWQVERKWVSYRGHATVKTGGVPRKGNARSAWDLVPQKGIEPLDTRAAMGSTSGLDSLVSVIKAQDVSGARSQWPKCCTGSPECSPAKVRKTAAGWWESALRGSQPERSKRSEVGGTPRSLVRRAGTRLLRRKPIQSGHGGSPGAPVDKDPTVPSQGDRYRSEGTVGTRCNLSLRSKSKRPAPAGPFFAQILWANRVSCGKVWPPGFRAPPHGPIPPI